MKASYIIVVFSRAFPPLPPSSNSSTHSSFQTAIMFKSPSQPHFFKAIRPEFMDGIKIPASFTTFPGTRKGFSGEATLITMSGREWRVEIEGGAFTQGWSTFARDNKLKCHDFVVFQLIGEMKFKVYVYDGVTQCGSVPQKQAEAADVKVNKLDGGISENSPESFTIELEPSQFKHKALSVPTDFASSNGLLKICNALLRDENQDDWPVKLEFCDVNRRLRLGAGWLSFAKAKGLKCGNHLKFEVIENGETPVLAVTFQKV